MKNWYKSKVIWFNLAVSVVTLAGLVTDAHLIPLSAVPYITVGVAFTNWVLRTYSTKEGIK